jgi:hypothetical protein
VRLLLIHQNFPGQFRQLAPHLFPGEELDAAIDLLDTEMLEMQRLPDWK